MFRCESRTRSENSNFPLKQVDNRLRDIPLALSRGCSPKHVERQSSPTVSNPKLKIHPPPSRKYEFAIRSPAMLHSQSISSPSSGCTRNHVHTQPLSFFQNPHQNPYTTARHLATMSKTRNRKYTY